MVDHFLPAAFGPHRVHLLRAVGRDRQTAGAVPADSVLTSDCWATRTGRSFLSEPDRGVRCVHLPAAGRHLCTPIGDGQHTAAIITVDLTLADHTGAAGVIGVETMVEEVAQIGRAHV